MVQIAQTVDSTEPDALDELAAGLAKVASDAVPSAQTRGGAAAGLPGVEIGGELPNILSKAARHRLVRHSQLVSLSLFATAAILAVVFRVLDAFTDAASSEAWQALLIGFVVAGILAYLISYLTVMGFGKVTIKVGSGGGSSDGGGSDGKDGDRKEDNTGDEGDGNGADERDGESKRGEAGDTR